MTQFYEKALFIIFVMYASSFVFAGVQYSLGDIMGIDMLDIDGNNLINGASGNDGILGSARLGELSNSTNTIVVQDELTVVNNPITAGAQIIWTLFQLITGTYIFNILILLGIPAIFVGGIVVLYIFMTAVTVAHYLLNR